MAGDAQAADFAAVGFGFQIVRIADAPAAFVDAGDLLGLVLRFLALLHGGNRVLRIQQQDDRHDHQQRQDTEAAESHKTTLIVSINIMPRRPSAKKANHDSCDAMRLYSGELANNRSSV